MRHYQMKRRRSSKKKLKQPIRHQSCCDVVMRALDYPKTTLLFVMLLLAAILITIVSFSDVNEDRNPMTRRLVSDSMFIDQYFKDNPHSTWFGSGLKKKDMLTKTVNAQNIVFDIDDVVLTVGLKLEVEARFKRRCILLRGRYKGGDSIVFSKEFEYWLEKKKLVGKNVYFNTNTYNDGLLDEYRDKIRTKMADKGISVEHFDRHFFSKTEATRSDPKKLSIMGIEKGERTVVIDNVVSNWSEDFNLEVDYKKYEYADGNIKKKYKDAFIYRHKTLPNTFGIWAKPWLPYEQEVAAVTMHDLLGFGFNIAVVLVIVYLVYTLLQTAQRYAFVIP